jgi:hypothetical protein
MTPKEKAWKLYHKYRTLEGQFGDKVLYNYDAKQCALIAVDYAINSYRQIERFETFEEYERLLEVKQEIEKL